MAWGKREYVVDCGSTRSAHEATFERVLKMGIYKVVDGSGDTTRLSRIIADVFIGGGARSRQKALSDCQSCPVLSRKASMHGPSFLDRDIINITDLKLWASLIERDSNHLSSSKYVVR